MDHPVNQERFIRTHTAARAIQAASYAGRTKQEKHDTCLETIRYINDSMLENLRRMHEFNIRSNHND